MDSNDLKDEVAALRAEVAQLNQHRWLQIHNSLPKLILFQLYRGLAFGLGTVLGATVLLSVLAWSLSQIDFIPIIGDWSRELLDIINGELGVERDGASGPGD